MTIDGIIRLGKELSDINDAAFDLWTWLPSNFFLRRYHGEYDLEFRGSVDDVMIEATRVLSAISGYVPEGLDLDLDAPYNCTCGEIHIPVQDDHEDWPMSEAGYRERFNLLKKQMGAL